MGSSSVEACCEAPEVFELVEAAFDPIAVFVEVGVVRDRDLARRERWDDGEHAGIGDELAKMVAVVGFVSNYGAGPSGEAGVDAFPFAISLRQVMPVRARAQHPQNTVDEEAI